MNLLEEKMWKESYQFTVFAIDQDLLSPETPIRLVLLSVSLLIYEQC
jgi:hypothetical protein